MPATIQRGFLLAEDEALKAKLSNVVVHDRDGARRAKVWFGYPSDERERSYPYISIELVDVTFAPDRAHSQQIVPVDYWPSEYASVEEYTIANGIVYDEEEDHAQAMLFVPVNLHYQVTTHARFAQHDRAMVGRLLGTAFMPFRHGFLDVPADQSVRHLTLEDWTPAHRFDEKGEREFRTVFYITVTADVAPEDLRIYTTVLSVHGELEVVNSDMETEEWDHVPAP